jgi:hypothetical protein
MKSITRACGLRGGSRGVSGFGGRRMARHRVTRASRGVRIRRSTLRVDCPALLGHGARRSTRCVRCALCAQTVASSQWTKRAGARGPAPCDARRLQRTPRPAHATLCKTCRWALAAPAARGCGGAAAAVLGSRGQRGQRGVGDAGGQRCRRRPISARSARAPDCWQPGRRRPGRAGHKEPSVEQRSRHAPRAQRASCSDSARLSERRERSERSELSAGGRAGEQRRAVRPPAGPRVQPGPTRPPSARPR